VHWPETEGSGEHLPCSEILNGIEDGIWVTDVDHRITLFNGVMERVFGLSADDVLGLDVRSGFQKMGEAFMPSYIEAQRCVEPIEFGTQFTGSGVESGEYVVRLVPRIQDHVFAGMVGMLRRARQTGGGLDDERPHLTHDYQATLDAANDAIWIVDRDQRIQRCNRAAEQLFNRPREELIGKQCWEVVHGTDGPVAGCPLVRARQSRKRETMELRIGEGWFLVVADPIMDEMGDFAGAVHVITDISELKRAEKALRESEERLRLIADASAEDIWQLDPEGRVIFVSQAVMDVFGYSVEEAMDLGIDAFFPESELERAREAFTEALSGRMRHQLLEFSGRRKDGSLVPIEVSVAPIIRGDRITGVQGIARDISMRKQAEEALREREKQYRSIFESVSDGLIIFDRSGRVVEVNPAACAMHRYTRDEMIGLSGLDFVHPDFHERFGEFYETTAEEEVFIEEPLDMRSDGSCFPVQVRGRAFEFRGESHILAFVIDITERRKAEAALQESERRFSTITENSADAIFTANRDGGYTYVNRAACALLGYSSEELLCMTIEDLLPQYDVDAGRAVFEELLEAGHAYAEMDLLCKDGSLIPVDLNAVVLPNGLVYESCRDLTERKRVEAERIALEAQLRQAQKLESIGTLASGVAHEINNPLTGVINYAQLIKDRASEDARVERYSQAVVNEGERIAAIVKNLLSFSRQDETEYSAVRIRDIVDNALALLHASLLKHQIELVVSVADDLPVVRCSSQQIQQVLVNLISNAKSALNERYPEYDPNKILAISADTLSDDEGRWLRIVVTDHGNGIPEGMQTRVFDPFFTSKSRDQGTGLGLSVSHGIILEHKGRIGFESVEGESTSFHVDLPLAGEAGG